MARGCLPTNPTHPTRHLAVRDEAWQDVTELQHPRELFLVPPRVLVVDLTFRESLSIGQASAPPRRVAGGRGPRAGPVPERGDRGTRLSDPRSSIAGLGSPGCGLSLDPAPASKGPSRRGTGSGYCARRRRGCRWQCVWSSSGGSCRWYIQEPSWRRPPGQWERGGTDVAGCVPPRVCRGTAPIPTARSTVAKKGVRSRGGGPYPTRGRCRARPFFHQASARPPVRSPSRLTARGRARPPPQGVKSACRRLDAAQRRSARRADAGEACFFSSRWCLPRHPRRLGTRRRVAVSRRTPLHGRVSSFTAPLTLPRSLAGGCAAAPTLPRHPPPLFLPLRSRGRGSSA